jgi:hypothetical protein
MTRAVKNFLVVCLFSLSTAVLAHASEYTFNQGNNVDISITSMTTTVIGTGANNEEFYVGGNSVTLPNNAILPGGAVTTIIDLPGTPCPATQCSLIGPALSLVVDATGFTITGQTVAAYESSVNYFNNNKGATVDPNAADNATITYLSGSFVAGSFRTDGGGDYGELFDVTETSQEVAAWTELEKYFGATTGSATNLDGDQVAFDLDKTNEGSTFDIEPWTETTPEPATLTLLCSGLAAGLLRKRLARKKV